jgi:hypothetical protein
MPTNARLLIGSGGHAMNDGSATGWNVIVEYPRVAATAAELGFELASSKMAKNKP